MQRPIKSPKLRLTPEERQYEYELKIMSGMAKTIGAGYIGNRQVKYEFKNISIKQALEIMTNGDCAD